MGDVQLLSLKAEFEILSSSYNGRLLTATILGILGIFFQSCKSASPALVPVLPDSEIHVKQFGAAPNDNVDDSESIQKAIQFAIASHSSSVIKFDPGIYDIGTGLTLINKNPAGDIFFITIHLLGHSATFDSDQRIGASTVFKSSSPGFSVAIQKARNCIIENIAFEGLGPVYNTPEDIINSEIQNWSMGGKLRVDRNSPHCAIAVDAFYSDTPMAHQYPGFEPFYKNTTTGGSSLLTIKGCSFSRYYIAIANNPSMGINNGDNLSAEQCYVSNCHTFWSCGQTQSRNNQIRNIYALFLHTFVSGTEIGRQIGTPPSVDNVNIAGFCKYVFNIETGFSGLWVSNSYMESIWSLGIVLTNSVSFNQCQIQFQELSDRFYAAPFQLYNQSVTHFRDCALEYFSDCSYARPFVLISKSLQLSGGWVEGGLVTANGYSNDGGEDLHNVSFENVFLKCQGAIAGKNSYERPIENLPLEILLGGTSVKSTDHSVFINPGNTYHIFSTGSQSFIINQSTKTGNFISNTPDIFKVGDNLFTDQVISLEKEGLKGVNLRPAIGYISKIAGKTITVSGIPEGVRPGTMIIYVAEVPVFIPPTWGEIIEGQNVITNIVAFSSSFYPRPGTRIYMPEFPNGTYVTGIDKIKQTITLSSKAVKSNAAALLKNANYTQDIYLEKWNPERIPVLIEGAHVHLKSPDQLDYHLVNMSRSILSTPYKANLKSIAE